jgi:hypothetical protein
LERKWLKNILGYKNPKYIRKYNLIRVNVGCGLAGKELRMVYTQAEDLISSRGDPYELS